MVSDTGDAGCGDGETVGAVGCIGDGDIDVEFSCDTVGIGRIC